MRVQDIKSYFKVVRKWWWVIVLLFGVTLGTMLALAFLSESQYEAVATIQVSAPPPQEVPLYSKYSGQVLRDEIELTRISLSEFMLEGDTPYRTVEALPDVHMAGGDLRDRVAIDMPENSQLVYVRVRAANAETAALLANTFVETGLEQYGQVLAKPTANTLQFIERELEVAREALKAAGAELAQFQIDNKVGSLGSAINTQYELIRSLRLQGDLARANGDLTTAGRIDEVVLQREAELQNMMALSAQYTELSDRVERARTTYNYLSDRKAEAQIKESQILESGYIQIITPARAPRKPVSAISGKLVVLGSVMSLLVGVLLTFLLEYLRVSGVLRAPERGSERSEAVAVLDRIA